MTIDERLQFLLQSTESLHANLQELHATVARQAEENRRRDAREAQLRRALLNGIEGFLRGLDGDGENGAANKGE